MRRKPFTLAAGASAVLCIGMCAFNAWSSRLNHMAEREDQARFGARALREGAHAELVRELVDRERAYREAHPHPNETELKQMDANSAELDRVTAERNQMWALPWPLPTPRHRMVSG